MKHLYHIVVVFIALLALATTTLAQTFDNFSPTANDTVEALVVQPDGKIWVGGAFTTLGGQSSQGLARVRADGSLDLAFNPGATTQNNNYGPQVIGLVIQPDGKVVAGGWFTSFAGIAHTNIVRLNPNGSVDGTFNLNFTPGLVLCLAMQADGKILAAAGNNIYRINTDGTLDAGFSVLANSTIDAVAIQPDSKILLAGAFTTVNGVSHNYVARINADGTVDSSFNFYRGPTSPADEASSLTVQPDGKIVVGTEHWNYVYNYFLGYYWQPSPDTLRVTSTGALDVRMGSQGFDSVLTMQADGKVLAGSVPIYRLNSTGTIDSNFVTSAQANVMALQSDGKLLLGNPVGRLNNTYAATQNLSLSGTTITWLRGGASPEVWRTTFEYSTDHGTNWVSLGAGTRISGGWQKTFASVPANANIRARGFIGGGDSSTWFVESIIGPVLITGQPDSRTNNAGTVANFSVTAGGTSLSYQWLKNGANIADGGSVSGAQTSALTLTNVLHADVAAYSVIISNSSGSITSRVVNLTVIEPFISIQPTNALGLHAGQTAVLSVTVSATNPTYHWFKDGTSITDSGNVAGTATANLIITNLYGGNAGNYWVTASNSFGSVTSVVSVLSVTDPFVLTNPSNLWVNPGQPGMFSATVAGTALTYQWRKNSADIAGETNATLIISSPQLDDNGAYDVAVSGTYGVTNSAAATLSVTVATPAPFESGVLNPTNTQDSIYATLFQSDGKILVAGFFTQLGANGSWFGRTNIGRLNSNGTVDLNFNPPVPNSTVLCLAEQTDGKVLLGGYFTAMDSVARYAIARLNADGSLDSTFQNGMGGVINNGSVYTIAVQPDGKILIGGYFDGVNGVVRRSIARLNVDGSLDTGFQNGMAGVNNIDVYNNVASGVVYSILLQPDGKIIIGGIFNGVNGVIRNNIARLNANGSLDPSLQSGMAGALGTVGSMQLQSDGKMVIVGSFTSVNNVGRNNMARLNSDGSLDTSFYPFANPSDYVVMSIPGRLALQTDGNILGLYASLSTGISGTRRISESGVIDPSFSLNADAPTATMLSENGQILVATYVQNINGQPRSGLCLLNNNPATQNLSCTSSTATWFRGGTSPEVYRTTFEISTNSGATWNSLGVGTRIPGGWQLAGMSNVPTNSGAMLRARGFASTGDWFVEHLLNLGSVAPSILVSDGSFGINANQFGFNFTGSSNQVVVIEGSTNLLSWVPIRTNTMGLDPTHFNDPNWTNFTKRFYRVRLQ